MKRTGKNEAEGTVKIEQNNNSNKSSAAKDQGTALSERAENGRRPFILVLLAIRGLVGKYNVETQSQREKQLVQFQSDRCTLERKDRAE